MVELDARAPGRTSTLRRHGKRQVRKLVDDVERNGGRVAGLSQLELRSVSPTTAEFYLQCVREFCIWSGTSLESLAGHPRVDELLVDYMNVLFEKGCKAWKGEKLLAGLCFYIPHYGRHGALSVPRTVRALKGWQKASPSCSRRPQAWPVWAAIAVEMCRQGYLVEAVMTMIMMDAYLRPSEMLSLMPASLLPPAPTGVGSWVLLLFPQEFRERSKVGASDDTIPLDSRRLRWLAPVLQELARRRPAHQRLLAHSYAAYLSLFRRTTQRLGVQVVPYQARHSGASCDRAENVRSLEATQKRGRWASQKSVKRYEKAGRVNMSWQELSPELQAHCMHCAKIIPDVVLHGAPCPPPPPIRMSSSTTPGGRRRAGR